MQGTSEIKWPKSSQTEYEKCSSNKDKLEGFKVKFYKKKLHEVQIMKNIPIILDYLTITYTEKLKITYILIALYKEIEPEQ